MVRELLNNCDKDSNEIVLGRAFKEKRELEIKEMIRIQLGKQMKKKTEDLMKKVMGAQALGNLSIPRKSLDSAND